MKLLLSALWLWLILALSFAAVGTVEGQPDVPPDVPLVAYVFTVSTTGETVVEVVVEGHETVLSLPKDVLAPEIQGGRYESTEAGLLVVPFDQAKAVIQFSSSYYTRKEEGVWHFFAEVAPSSAVNVTLPFSVKVIQARPRPFISKTATEPKLTLVWREVSKDISFSYAFLDGGYSEYTGQPETPKAILWLGVVAIVLIGAAGLAFLWYRKRAKRAAKHTMAEPASVASAGDVAKGASSGRLEERQLTEGQINILRAANHNEGLVLRVLLRHNGQLKRNALEKESGLSKSSLASSVHNLEKKNLIEVDRTFHVHYLTLSKWFKELL